MTDQRAAHGKGSTRVVYVALAGNLLVAASKFAAAAVSGSSAMLSEGIHSVVDTANELLLLYGIRRSALRPDPSHPLGYGRELFFWSFIVALLIFVLGAGTSVYQGVVRILHPEPIGDPTLTYWVLGCAALFEGSSWIYTLHRYEGRKNAAALLQAVVRSKDPPFFIVLLEDSVALVGIAVAFAGVYLSVLTSDSAYDGAASILIGAILALTAFVLGRETKGLLIGEPARQRTRDDIFRLAGQAPGVCRINDVLSMHLAPREIVVALSIEFEDELTAPGIESAVIEIERRIQKAHPAVSAVFIKPQTRGRFQDGAGFDPHRNGESRQRPGPVCAK